RLETDVLQGGRHHGGGRADITRNGLSLRRGGSCEQREDTENVAGLSHLLISSSPPKALKKKANPSLRRFSSRLRRESARCRHFCRSTPIFHSRQCLLCVYCASPFEDPYRGRGRPAGAVPAGNPWREPRA